MDHIGSILYIKFLLIRFLLHSVSKVQKSGEPMSIRAKKMLFDFDYGTSHGRLTFDRDEIIDLTSIVITPPPLKYLQETIEIPMPLFDKNNMLTAVREVGPDGTYYLRLRSGYYLSRIVIDPDDVFVDVTFREEHLVYCFHNGTRRNCIAITAVISEDVGGVVVDKLNQKLQDAIWRQYIVRDALLKSGVQKISDPSELTPNIMTAIEVACYLRVEEKTIRNWTSAGRIPYVKVGGTTRYKKEDIDSAFSSGLVGNTSKWKKRQANTKGKTKEL